MSCEVTIYVLFVNNLKVAKKEILYLSLVCCSLKNTIKESSFSTSAHLTLIFVPKSVKEGANNCSAWALAHEHPSGCWGIIKHASAVP